MNPANASRGQLIAAASAVLLLIFLFLSWFEITGFTASVPGIGEQTIGAEELAQTGEDLTGSGWEGLSTLFDLLILIAIVGTLGLVAASLAGAAARLPVPVGRALAGLGILALAVVVFVLIFPPSLEPGAEIPDEIDIDVDVSRQLGLFLGLIAAAGMAVGGVMANREGDASGPASRSGSSSTTAASPAGPGAAGTTTPGATGSTTAPPPSTPPATERRPGGGPPAT